MYPLHHQQCNCIFTLWFIIQCLIWLYHKCFGSSMYIYRQYFINPGTSFTNYLSGGHRVMSLQFTLMYRMYSKILKEDRDRNESCFQSIKCFKTWKGNTISFLYLAQEHVCEFFQQAACKYMEIFTYMHMTYVYIYHNQIHNRYKLTWFLEHHCSFKPFLAWRLARPMAAKSEAILGENISCSTGKACEIQGKLDLTFKNFGKNL